MKIPQDQLITLLISNSRPAWEIEALYKRCCIYYGLDFSLDKCQDIIYFADMANIELLESFRLHIQIEELTIDRTNK